MNGYLNGSMLLYGCLTTNELHVLKKRLLKETTKKVWPGTKVAYPGVFPLLQNAFTSTFV